MKSVTVCIFVLLNMFVLEAQAQISWQAPFTVTFSSDISNLGGPIHLAADFNRPEAFNPDEDLLFVQGDFNGEINGIQFTGTNQNIAGLLETNLVGFVGSDLSGPRFPPGAANASTFLDGDGGPFYQGPPADDADLNNLLDSHAFRRVDSFGTLTVEGLTVGDEYQIQLVGIADGRPGAASDTTVVDNQVGLTRGLYQSTIGRFTAGSTSQTIGLTEGDGVGLSGIVVQRVAAVPEPSSCWLLVIGSATLLARRRR